MNLVDLILYVGIFVFAATGALKARTHRMDIFGAGVLAFVTAYGGGTLRDLLIGIRPVNWMNDYVALVLVFCAVGIVSLLKTNVNRFTRTLFFTDAIGLGLFTIGGIERSLSHGVNEGYAIIMGVMSATFGGLVADVISNTVPALLKKGELYATACAIGGIIFIVLRYLGTRQDINLWVCIVIVVAVRVLSKVKRVRLPEI